MTQDVENQVAFLKKDFFESQFSITFHHSPSKGVETSRGCLPRPPPHGREHCANIRESGSKVVFMCFCRGDLCNGET